MVVAAAPARQVPPEVAIVLGPRAVALTDYYTLGFRLRGAALQQYTEFPELEGFRKSGKTSTTTTRVVQGRSFSELTISQRYAPYGEGEFVIKPFQLTVNGLLVRSAGGRVRVGPAPPLTPTAPTPPAAAKPAASPGSAPGPAGPTPPPAANPSPAPASPPAGIGSLDQLLGKPKPALYTEPPDRAFLAIVAERPQVFVGQGVRVGLYFYLTPADQALLAFHDYNDQLPSLLRQLRQPGAWEVPAPEAPATPDSVRRGTQLYLRYRLAESTYYPLTSAPLLFPALALTMTKFRVLKKPEPGVDNRLATYKTYLAPGLRVAVRPLPPRPAGADGVVPGAEVAVGDYELRERLSLTRPRAGQPFTYVLAVEGRGNLAALAAPPLGPRPGLDVYGPDVREERLPGGAGRKTFRYRLVARQPGPLPLDSLVQLAIFNPRTARYAVLRPRLRPVVLGRPPTPLPRSQPTDDPFYGPALAGADATLQDLDVYARVRQAARYLVLAVLGVAAVGWWRSRRF